MSIVKDKTKAFILYAHLSIQNRIGSDGRLRVPSKVLISCQSLGDVFDFEASYSVIMSHVQDVLLSIVKGRVRAFV